MGLRPLGTTRALGDGISRDPIGEKGGKNPYATVGNNLLSRIDPLGLFWHSLPGGGGYLDPEDYAPIPADPLAAEAWRMFFHLYFGDLDAEYNLSPEVIEAAKARVNRTDLIESIRDNVVCGQSGQTPISHRDPQFSIENTWGVVQMGKWDVHIQGTASWQCDGEELKDGKCCCKCRADVSAHVTMWKTYTFREGYNSYNSDWQVQLGNALAITTQYYVQWHEDNWGPAYFVRGEFDLNFNQPFHRCRTAKNALPAK